MSTQLPTTADEPHLAEWIDRLQDAVDGALVPSDLAAVQAHLADCAICRGEHRRLLAIDARLRGEFTAAPAMSADFDRRVLARIDALEHERRALAKQREQQEFEKRLTAIRGGWRQWVRFHLGNVIGVAATIAAVVSALASMWPDANEGVTGLQPSSWLPQGWSTPATLVAASVIVAAASLIVMRRLERRSL